MRTYVMQVATGRERQTVQLLERVLGGAPRAELFVPRYRYRKKIKGAWQFTEELLRDCGGNPGPNPSYATSPKSLRYCMGLL